MSEDSASEANHSQISGWCHWIMIIIIRGGCRWKWHYESRVIFKRQPHQYIVNIYKSFIYIQKIIYKCFIYIPKIIYKCFIYNLYCWNFSAPSAPKHHILQYIILYIKLLYIISGIYIKLLYIIHLLKMPFIYNYI